MRRRFYSNISQNNIDINDYLTIEALEDDLQISFIKECEYCIDGSGNWNILVPYLYTPKIAQGQTLSLKGNIITNSNSGISVTKRFNLIGNVMSLLFGDNGKESYSLEGYDYAFAGLFANCSKLISISANFLPATILSKACYRNMFSNCNNLISVPTLPALKLEHSCYNQMFLGCSNLNYIKMLATDIYVSYCLTNWVNGVASTGTFVKNPAMNSLLTGTDGIPSGWTVVNDGEE